MVRTADWVRTRGPEAPTRGRTFYWPRSYTRHRTLGWLLFVFHSNVCLAQPFESYYRCAARETIREGPT